MYGFFGNLFFALSSGTEKTVILVILVISQNQKRIVKTDTIYK